MSVFRESELRYLAGGKQLGRLATVGADGTPHVVPVAWIYNAVRDTIDVSGSELAETKKFRDVARSGRAAIVVDDVGEKEVAAARDRGPRPRGGDRDPDAADPDPSRADRQLGPAGRAQRAHGWHTSRTVNAAVLHEHDKAPELRPVRGPASREPGAVVVEVAAAGLHHLDLLKASGSFYMGPPPLPSRGRHGRRREARGRPARLLRRDGPAVRLDGREGARARRRAVRRRRGHRRRHRRGARQHRARRLARRDLALRDGAGRHRARARRAARSGRSPCRSPSCAARAGSSRPTAAGSGWSACSERGADAVVALDEEDDLADAFRTPPAATSTSRSTPSGATPRPPRSRPPAATPATCRSATSPGPTITLPAPALRSVSLDLRGFRVDLPPPEQRRQGFLDLTRHVAQGDIAVDVESRRRCSDVADGLGAPAPRRGRREARAGSLTAQPAVWNGAGAARGRGAHVERDRGRPSGRAARRHRADHERRARRPARRRRARRRRGDRRGRPGAGGARRARRRSTPPAGSSCRA